MSGFSQVRFDFNKPELNRQHIFLLVIIPLIANALALSGYFKCDPELMHSGLDVGLRGYLFPGAACYLDPDVAYITQPLGFLSAKDWLHGIIPWWNPYSGVGMPLAAEMQTQSFFLPFILLMHFHDGWLYQRIILQILTGFFSYIFIIELGVGSFAALLGAALFSLNGAFILTPHAVIGPIFCLPMMLYGIEHALRAARNHRPMGWSLVALGLAYSIYAGFPEVAYFDGFLVASWTLLRFFQVSGKLRWRFAGKVALAGSIGLALTAPLSNGFLRYIAIADIGGHGGLFAQDILHAMAAPIQMFPMIYGAFGRFPPAGLSDHGLWIRVGGWFGSTPVLVALYSLFSARGHKAERYLLAAWILVFEARYFGVFGIASLLNLMPGEASTDILRFSPISVDFAMFVLTAYGFDDLRNGSGLPAGRLRFLFGLYAILCVASLAPVIPILPIWFGGYFKLIFPAIAFLIAVIISNAVLIRAMLYQRGAQLAFMFMLAGGIGIFWLSQISAPRSGHLNLAGLTILDQDAELGRSYTLGPFGPNYSAAYGLSQINYQQLPVPVLWTDFISATMFPGSDTLSFGGDQNGQMAALLAHLSTLEAIGTKYIIAQSNQTIAPDASDKDGVPGWNRYRILFPGQEFSNLIPPVNWSSRTITSVSIVVGTFVGQSTGPLDVQLCDGARCATGRAALEGARDNQPFLIPLSQPITLQPGQAVFYRFSHPQGWPVAIWISPEIGGARSPDAAVIASGDQLVFQRTNIVPVLSRIYHDQTMDIYQLPNPALFAQTDHAGCPVTIYSREKMDTNCFSPATLVRRELFFPGWRATVNGNAAQISQTEDIFQQIDIPAGPAKIRFTYMPPYTPLACAAAIAAALFWLAAGLLSRRRLKS